MDSVLAARITSFLEGSTDVLGCRGFQPVIEQRRDGDREERSVSVAYNERRRGSNRTLTPIDDAVTVKTPAMAEEIYGPLLRILYPRT